MDYLTIGRYICSVRAYVESVDKISKRTYLSYVRENSASLALTAGAKEGILHFLSYCNVGYRSAKPARGKVLNKLQNLSVQNQKDVNEFAHWLETKGDYSPHTICTYVWTMRQFFQYATDFSQESARNFVATMEAEGKAVSTVIIRITALLKFGEFLKKNIVIKRPKKATKLHTDNIPTKKDFEILIEWLKEHDRIYYLYVRILSTTGARCSEFQKLKWSDIIDGEVTLKGKGAKYRRFFFTKALSSEVKAAVKDGLFTETDYVAMSRHGTRLTQRAFSQKLKTIGKKCGVDRSKMHPHAFRHFFAMRYLEESKNDIVGLADLMGHGKLETTRLYLQKSYEEQKRDFNKRVTW